MRKLLLIAGVASLALPLTALAQSARPMAQAAIEAGREVAYTGSRDDISARESWLENHIHEGNATGALSRGDSEHDFDTLRGIRDFEDHQAKRHDGLNGADRADIMNKLDNLTAVVHSQWAE